MNFLLLQPPLLDVTYNEVQPPPGHLFTIFSYLKRNNPGLKIDVSDLTHDVTRFTGGENLIFSRFLKNQFKKYAPDVLGISCYSSMHYIITELVAAIFKEENPEGIVVVGGYHPTVVPGDFTAPGAPYDYIILGEGEIALSRLLKQPLSPQHQAKLIRGTALNLEEEELMWDDYPVFKRRGEKIIVFLSRGCPFRCNFCLDYLKMQPGDPGYRVYSSAKARSTIKTVVKKFNPQRILFGDPIFGFNAQWRRQFLKDLLEVAPDTQFWAETRVDTFSPGDVNLLKSLRFRLDFGLDAIIPENVTRQNKSRNPQEYIGKFLTLDNYMNSQKIPHSAYILYNYPGETPQTYHRTRQTLRDIAKKRSYNYSCFVGQAFCLYPGTMSYRKMKHYEEKYGSRFPNDGWWREIADDKFALARAIVASTEMAGEKIDFSADVRQLFAETIPDKDLLLWPGEVK